MTNVIGLTKEALEAIIMEHVKIGQSHIAIAEYYKSALKNVPTMDEVVPAAEVEVKDAKASKKTKTPKKQKEEVAPEPEVVDEEVAEDDSRYVFETEDGEINLQEMDLKELKELAKDLEIKVPARTKADKLREMLADALAELVAAEEEEEDSSDEEAEDVAEEEDVDGDDEEEEVEEDEEEEESETTITYVDEDGDEITVDLAELSSRELKKLAKELDITLTSKKADGMIDEILEAYNAEDEEVEEEDEDEEEEQDLAEELGLNDMSVEELAEMCEEYELSTKGKKQALIARIVKAVEDGDIELADEEEGE